ncbi:MAG TPA: rhodanese-like domain-containing protein [Balneolaceae bacterium]|nr:rhodanese-like domain-containing protein [Balneolaceae bacterium]
MFNNFMSLTHDDDRELAKALAENPFVIDVRTPEEYATGTFEQAVNIPLQELPNHLSECQGQDRIIVFCRSGHRSEHAKQFLAQQSIGNVLNGGNKDHLNTLK